MSNVRVHTVNSSRNLTKVIGTQVFVGDQQIEDVVSLELESELDGVWMLKMSVLVNPADLFVEQAKPAP